MAAKPNLFRRTTIGVSSGRASIDQGTSKMKKCVGLNKTGRILVAAAAAGCAMISSAHAAIVTHVFSGYVAQVGVSGATLGNDVTVTLVYDSEQAPIFSDPPNQAFFDEFELSLVTEGFSPSRSNEEMLVFNNYAEGSAQPVDAFQAGAGGLFVTLIDTSMTAFDSNTLPTMLNLSDFGSALAFFVFGGAESDWFYAQLTSVETTISDPSEIPLPAAFWMMALGLGALVRHSRRKSGA